MDRTQISLEREQAERLRRLARDRGVSMAHLIRDAVDTVYGSDAAAAASRAQVRARALGAVGCGRSGGGDIATEHDASLDEIYDS